MRLKKRTLVLLGAAVVAIGLAVGAYAYFTATGSGTGTATVGTSANNIYVSGTTGGTLYPGGPSQTVSFTAKNFANFGQSVSSIHLTNVQSCVAAWSAPNLTSYPVPAPTCSDSLPADTTADAACDAGGFETASNSGTKNWYMPDTTVDPTSSSDGKLAANDNRALASTGTILMENTSVSQDDCKSKNLLLTFTTS